MGLSIINYLYQEKYSLTKNSCSQKYQSSRPKILEQLGKFTP
jgi:hypothetical protein